MTYPVRRRVATERKLKGEPHACVSLATEKSSFSDEYVSFETNVQGSVRNERSHFFQEVPD